MNILLTGAGGFIGAHCLKYFLKHTKWNIIALDSFYHKGTPQRIIDLVPNYDCDRVKIIKHDLTVPLDQPLINKIGNIDIIINMASDSAVERSGSDPRNCLMNNYQLMINILEYTRKIKPNIFFQVSTDEVYGQAGILQKHKEWDSIIPSNPYSASKVAQEAIAISYWRCFDVPIVITNTVNNFGETQDPEKFLPKILQHAYKNKTMPVYNNGSRFYLYAANHADVFVFLSQIPPILYDGGKNQLPDRYNVTGGKELTNQELVQEIELLINKKIDYELVNGETFRQGYDKRYCLDGSKLNIMGWKPPIDFEHGLKQTIEWSLNNKQWILT